MASIELKPSLLRVHLHGWNKVRALRGSVTVPFSHIAGVRAYPLEADFDEAITDSGRGVGTYWPGHMAVGTVTLRDGPSFFDVHGSQNVVAIDLDGNRLRHIVVELENESAEGVVARIEKALHMRWPRP